MSNAYTFTMPICGAKITIENVDNIRVNTIETLILSNDQTIDVMDMYVSTFREDKAAPPVYDVMKTLYYYRYIDREGLLDPPDKYSLVWTTMEGRTYLLNEVMLKDINENIEREQS